MADCPSIRCIVQEMTDDQAVIIMVDSNLHREETLPSEKAFAYKMKLDAMKRQGQRTDLTSSPVATKFDAATELGREYGESRDQVFRYIRLTSLIPEILEMVDNSVLKEKDKLQIALRPAVELSHLTEQEQRDLTQLSKTFVKDLPRKWTIWHPLVLSLRCHPEKKEIGGMNDDADTRTLPLGRSPELQDSLSRCILRQHRQSWRYYGSRKHSKGNPFHSGEKALFSGCRFLLF